VFPEFDEESRASVLVPGRAGPSVPDPIDYVCLPDKCMSLKTGAECLLGDDPVQYLQITEEALKLRPKHEASESWSGC
jgi:hypothetical protein